MVALLRNAVRLDIDIYKYIYLYTHRPSVDQANKELKLSQV